MKTRYCLLCKREISPIKSPFSVLGFLIVGLLPYLIWYAIKPKTRCPICKSNHLSRPKKHKNIKDIKSVKFNEQG